MKLSTVLILCLFIACTAIGAGCTQLGNTPGPVATSASPAPALSPGALALTAADAPANYTLVQSRGKSPDEVGKLAKELGWQNGYVVAFSSRPGTGKGQTKIVQNIVTYPDASIVRVVQITKTNEMASKDLLITSLPSPGLGDDSIAFTGTANGQGATQQNNNPLVQETAGGKGTEDMVEIIFSRGSTMEVLRMTGPDASYATLRALAETAYARIP
jgi:hypothetical protein